MSSVKPFLFKWSGFGMVPLAGQHLRCAERFVVNGRYGFVIFDGRSEENHSHYFAVIRDYWNNWPESYEIELSSEKQLRRHALIRTGHYDQHIMALASKEDAERYIERMTEREGYAEFSLNESVVVARFAKTQRKNFQSNADFKKAKQDVLDFMASVTGIPVEQMKREAGQAA